MTGALRRLLGTVRRTQPGALDLYFGSLRDGHASIEREFFLSLRLSNGTAKTSADHRLDDLNAVVAPLLAIGRPLAIMDAAAGSGISSLEWVDQLRASGRDVQLTAGDLSPWCWVTSWGTRCAIVSLDDGRAPSVELYGRRFSLDSERWIVRRVRTALAAGLAAAVATIGARVTSPPFEPPRAGRMVHRRVALVSPRVVARKEIEVIPDDLMEGGRFQACFDAVRATNVLNRAYFPEPILTLMITTLAERVRDGGLLIIGRTEEETGNHATVFRRSGTAMSVQARLGRGSEVEALVLSAQPSARS